MAALPEHRLLTPDELALHEDAVAYELRDGVMVERSMSYLSSRIAARLIVFLGRFVSTGHLGDVLGPDIGILVLPGHRTVLRPDVAFLMADRITPDVVRSGYLGIPPDFVAEVVSPGDTATRLQEKVDRYLAAGVRLIWVVYPEGRKVHVFRADGTISAAGIDGTVTGEDVVPGFSMALADLFVDLPQPVEQPDA